jgi:hypothetical protein
MNQRIEKRGRRVDLNQRHEVVSVEKLLGGLLMVQSLNYPQGFHVCVRMLCVSAELY